MRLHARQQGAARAATSVTARASARIRPAHPHASAGRRTQPGKQAAHVHRRRPSLRLPCRASCWLAPFPTPVFPGGENNIAAFEIDEAGSRRDVPAGLAMFRIGNDGLLSLVRTYPRRAAGIADPGLSPGRPGGTAIFARLSGGVDARDYPVRVAAKATQLPWGQDVDGERSHVCHVRGCRFGEYLEALLGQDGADGAPVCGIGLPADQTSPLEAGE